MGRVAGSRESGQKDSGNGVGVRDRRPCGERIHVTQWWAGGREHDSILSGRMGSGKRAASAGIRLGRQGTAAHGATASEPRD